MKITIDIPEYDSNTGVLSMMGMAGNYGSLESQMAHTHADDGDRDGMITLANALLDCP
jgi:hypothetical protein